MDLKSKKFTLSTFVWIPRTKKKVKFAKIPPLILQLVTLINIKMINLWSKKIVSNFLLNKAFKDIKLKVMLKLRRKPLQGLRTRNCCGSPSSPRLMIMPNLLFSAPELLSGVVPELLLFDLSSLDFCTLGVSSSDLFLLIKYIFIHWQD